MRKRDIEAKERKKIAVNFTAIGASQGQNLGGQTIEKRASFAGAASH